MLTLYLLWLLEAKLAHGTAPVSDTLQKGVWMAMGQGHRKTYGNAFAFKKYDYHASAKFIELANGLASPTKDVYQFGVYTGGSMAGMAQKIKSYGLQYGFDSFQGLPSEATGVAMQGPHWKPGGFSAADALGTYSYEKILEQILAKLPKERRAQARFVRGYYNESLVDGLLEKHHFQPALIVDVDVDLYQSTMDCMGWMLRNGLIIPGTLVRYDDWNAKTTWGETRAHMELAKQFGLEWRNITDAQGLRRAGYAEFQLTSCRCCGRRHLSAIC